MIGIKDIAKEATASPATVARVLRNPDLVIEGKRNRRVELARNCP